MAEANDEALIRLLGEPGVAVALGAVLAALGLIGIVAVIAASVRLIGRSVVARTPVTGEHAFELPGPGGYALHLEGPMFSRMRLAGDVVAAGPVLRTGGRTPS